MKQISMIALCGAMILSGCQVPVIASNPSMRDMNNGNVSQSVKRGMSQQQVLAKMGKPASKTSQNGIEVWTYASAKIGVSPVGLLAPSVLGSGLGSLTGQLASESTRGRNSSKHLRIVFNRSGRVSKVDFSTQES
jgi:outer membrane protein assembly factor BamE (lipoprotein component of BamABCDE complex)